MKEGGAMDTFKELISRGPELLDKPIEELLPISFVGAAAVSAYRSWIRKLDSLPMAEEQKRETLRDGQNAGKMLLAIEARIGELLPRGDRAGWIRTEGSTKKATRLNLPIDGKRAHVARQIFNNPDAVAEVIAEAEENGDIPTKTAVLNKVRDRRRRERAHAYAKDRVEAPPELSRFLDACITRQRQTNIVLSDIVRNKEYLPESKLEEFVGEVVSTLRILSTDRSLRRIMHVDRETT